MTQAVVVTGAAGGIGAALCKRMREDGYLTIGIDRESAVEADIDLQTDLRNIEQLIGLGHELARDYELKAIVHNAAVQPIARAGETSLSDWVTTLQVNVVAADALLSGTRESLAANGGSVVVVVVGQPGEFLLASTWWRRSPSAFNIHLILEPVNTT